MCVIYPEKQVKSAVLHELRDDHRWSALGDHALQPDNVGLVKLAHDGRLGQEVPPLPLGIAHLQGLDGHRNFFFPNRLQATFVHLPKLTCRGTKMKKYGSNRYTVYFRGSAGKVCSRGGKQDERKHGGIIAKVADFAHISFHLSVKMKAA